MSRAALVLFVLFTVVFGGLYPLAVWGVAQLAFPSQANGSLVVRDGVVLGSHLVAQPIASPRFVSPRPSATGNAPYDATTSGGANMGPSSPELRGQVSSRLTALGLEVGVPVELVTASASGLDPHLSPEAVAVQLPRVAAARGLSLETVQAIARAHVQPPLLGVFGEPRVEVLALDLALDALDAGAVLDPPRPSE